MYLGGTISVNCLIWGYASSKRLRTPTLIDVKIWSIKIQYIFALGEASIRVRVESPGDKELTDR
jgi:hypothetical protein